MSSINGSCLCGQIKFKVRGELRKVIFCHCTQCLKSHGHYGAYTATSKDDLTFIRAETLNWYSSSKKARRGFCRECGSTLFFEASKSDSISISAGSLISSVDLKPLKHIYFSRKPDYYEIRDNLPKK